ncbi:single-stranded DNA-binding protein [Mycoplasma leonicaptivi]|uniref:single-stranded DNA-binding protein n=1 Tax=Mycoplasma leonicaptivi TaxID=36742 RepID=UPI00048492E8|nr:single-stranded DNA-binding protein [Mycoplasma leonicaptivi]
MLNKVSLIGRIANDVKIDYTSQNIPYARITVAVNRDTYGNSQANKIADFIPVTAWRHQADAMQRFAPKGTLIYVEGELHVNQYTNKENQFVRAIDVQLERFRVLESKQAIENKRMSHSGSASFTPRSYDTNNTFNNNSFNKPFEKPENQNVEHDFSSVLNLDENEKEDDFSIGQALDLDLSDDALTDIFEEDK